MNPFDRAQELELEEWERNQLAAIAPRPSRESATHCEDCGAPIPEDRRAAQPGCTLCVGCKALAERQATRWKK